MTRTFIRWTETHETIVEHPDNYTDDQIYQSAVCQDAEKTFKTSNLDYMKQESGYCENHDLEYNDLCPACQATPEPDMEG